MKIVNLTPEIVDTILYKEEDLRISLIAKLAALERLESGELCVCSLPPSSGVAIEVTRDKGESYIVICFIEPDEDGKIKIKQVGSRSREYKKEKLENIKKYDKFVKMAKQFVKEALKKDAI